MKWVGKINFDGRPQYHTDGLVTVVEVDTVSGSLQTNIDGKSDTIHLHDDRYYTESEVDTISGSLQTNIGGKSDTSHLHDDRYYTETEVDTVSGSLQTNIDSKAVTFLELSDTPAAYDDNKYAKSTASGIEWVTVSGGSGSSDHSTLSNLGYVTSGHIGFQASGDYTTDAELTSVSGALQTNIDGKITNLSEDTTPELSGQLGVGELDIKLDALLSADGKYSGMTRDGVLGATLAHGDLVYLNTTDQRWELADAGAEITSGDIDLAIVLAGGDDGDTRLLLTDGYVREDDWNFTSYGQALFVSTIAGDMTQTAPSASGDIVRVVGKAGTTADQIHFKPSQTWIELS